jgi:hypothetical protein
MVSLPYPPTTLSGGSRGLLLFGIAHAAEIYIIWGERVWLNSRMIRLHSVLIAAYRQVAMQRPRDERS